MSAALIQAVTFERDADGSWWHPDMPSFDEGDGNKWHAWLAEQGLTTARAELQDEPLDHPVYVEVFENGASSFRDWTPTPPEGDGWFTLAIGDTEDGPAWSWARRANEVQP